MPDIVLDRNMLSKTRDDDGFGTFDDVVNATGSVVHLPSIFLDEVAAGADPEARHAGLVRDLERVARFADRLVICHAPLDLVRGEAAGTQIGRAAIVDPVRTSALREACAGRLDAVVGWVETAVREQPDGGNWVDIVTALTDAVSVATRAAQSRLMKDLQLFASTNIVRHPERGTAAAFVSAVRLHGALVGSIVSDLFETKPDHAAHLLRTTSVLRAYSDALIAQAVRRAALGGGFKRATIINDIRDSEYVFLATLLGAELATADRWARLMFEAIRDSWNREPPRVQARDVRAIRAKASRVRAP